MSAQPGFTPGPWTIGKVEQPRQCKDWTDHGGCRIDAPGIEQLCYVWNSSSRFNPETKSQDGTLPFGSSEAEANARLIAAAPELLDALRDVLRIATAASLGVTGNQPRLERARAAIARAQGGQS